MKNKRLIFLLTILVAALVIFIYKNTEKTIPVNIKAVNIENITIKILDSLEGLDVKSDTVIIFTREDNINTIQEITPLLNRPIKHPNQNVGTTHPIHVNIKSNNNKDIGFGCGVGDFITLSYKDKQYNCISEQLNTYIYNLIINAMDDVNQQ